jgi:hypothetical protein
MKTYMKLNPYIEFKDNVRLNDDDLVRETVNKLHNNFSSNNNHIQIDRKF